MENSSFQRMWGLHRILNASQSINQLLYSIPADAYKIPVQLRAHPFGLSIPSNTEKIYFLGLPGVTQVSVDMLTTYIAYHLTFPPDPDSIPISVLREIFLQTDSHDSSKHMVFFEVMAHNDVLLCGGCTDCSGTGGAGRKRLEEVFTFLSSIYNVLVEKVEIPFARTSQMEKSLSAQITAQHEG